MSKKTGLPEPVWAPPNLRHSRYAAPELIAPHSYTNDAFVYKRWGRIGPEIAATVSEMPPGVGGLSGNFTAYKKEIDLGEIVLSGSIP